MAPNRRVARIRRQSSDLFGHRGAQPLRHDFGQSQMRTTSRNHRYVAAVAALLLVASISVATFFLFSAQPQSGGDGGNQPETHVDQPLGLRDLLLLQLEGSWCTREGGPELYVTIGRTGGGHAIAGHNARIADVEIVGGSFAGVVVFRLLDSDDGGFMAEGDAVLIGEECTILRIMSISPPQPSWPKLPVELLRVRADAMQAVPRSLVNALEEHIGGHHRAEQENEPAGD